MKKFLTCLLIGLFCGASVIAQITQSPSIDRKSTKDIFITKIELTDQFTILSMKFVSRSAQQQLKDYLEENPDMKRELQRMDSFSRSLYMRQLMMQLNQGSSTISIQPSSFLRAASGKKFKFIKATNIPVSPKYQTVSPDKTYSFQVYFERVTPGIEKVDLLESNNDKDGSMTYWNFNGIHFNNPAEEQATPLAALPETATIKLIGKVLDAESNQPISAKIICISDKSNQRFDSVTTSRSGSYEFSLLPENYLYEITAEGYERSEETFDVSNLTRSGTFKRDFYLTPKKPENGISEPSAQIIDEVEPEQVNETTFRLDKVYFASGQATVLPTSYEQLDGLVKLLKENPTMKIRVEGHTDDRGEPALNQRLSLDRAFQIREFLIKKGIAGNRVQFKGYGDTQPLAPNDTEENRQKNRRVEFVILEK